MSRETRAGSQNQARAVCDNSCTGDNELPGEEKDDVAVTTRVGPPPIVTSSISTWLGDLPVGAAVLQGGEVALDAAL